MTSTENFFRDGYLADWTHHWRRSRFIQETWQSPSDRHSHQLWIQTRWLELHLHRQSNRGCSESPTSPNPMGLLSSIFANDNKGPIDKETLCTLCVLILDESLPSLSGIGIGCVRARVFPCEPIFRRPAGEIYLCSNWSDVYLILRLAPIWLELQSWSNRCMFTIGGNVIDFNFFCT